MFFGLPWTTAAPANGERLSEPEFEELKHFLDWVEDETLA